MRLWIISDLHLRHRGEAFRVPPADVCVCAGDVGEGLGETVRWLSERVGTRMPVVLVAGNHEFYGSSIAAEFYTARQVIEEGRGEGVHLLEQESVVLGGARFLGATLWTDYALRTAGKSAREAGLEIGFAMTAAERMVTDHYTIHVGDGGIARRWTPADARAVHLRSRAWLEEAMAMPHDGSTVVVTHHSPHPRSISPGYEGSVLNPAFASDLTDIIAVGQPDLWVHGHVHSSHDYVLGSTRVVCNPRGYVQQGNDENDAFEPRLVIEVTS